MKKNFLILFALLGLGSICFAQSTKYRYAFITESSIIIADLKDELPEERVAAGYPMVLPLNTSDERFRAESGIRKVESFFYSGTPFIYADYTKDPEKPDMSYIDSWTDVMAYVRGKK